MSITLGARLQQCRFKMKVFLRHACSEVSWEHGELVSWPCLWRQDDSKPEDRPDQAHTGGGVGVKPPSLGAGNTHCCPRAGQSLEDKAKSPAIGVGVVTKTCHLRIWEVDAQLGV